MRLLPIIALLFGVFAAPLLSAEVLNSDQISAELRSSFPRVQWRFFDKRYETVSSDLFTREFAPYFASYLRERGISGVTAGFGQRQYAELCKEQLNIWLRKEHRRNVQGAAAVVVTDTQAMTADRRIPSGWLLIRFEEGWYIFAPVSYTLVPLRTFAYRASISAVQF